MQNQDIENKSRHFVIDQIQLILAEKRTSLSVLRTGIAVFTLPLSVLTILIATSRSYNVFDILSLFIPLVVICVGLVGFGMYLIIKSSRNIRHYDTLIKKVKEESRLSRQMVE
jgi:uncharacterized membrane protein YidH (DUF202 family)